MSEIKFHDSVAERFRNAATDITNTTELEGDHPVIEGVQVIGYVAPSDPRDRCLIVWYEGKYWIAGYHECGWEDTHKEEDETFVCFYPTKPVPRYDWM